MKKLFASLAITALVALPISAQEQSSSSAGGSAGGASGGAAGAGAGAGAAAGAAVGGIAAATVAIAADSTHIPRVDVLP